MPSTCGLVLIAVLRYLIPRFNRFFRGMIHEERLCLDGTRTAEASALKRASGLDTDFNPDRRPTYLGLSSDPNLVPPLP